MRPRAQLVTILFAALAIGGCGGSDTAPSTSKFSIRETPSYKTARTACGAVPRETLARGLGLSTSDPVAIARKYAEQKAPLAARQRVYEGCYAALTK